MCQVDKLNRAEYKNRRIHSIDKLALALNTNLQQLVRIAEEADALYWESPPKPKSNGTFRTVYDANFRLKRVQQRIKTQILNNVVFPEYLTGSIRGRDYVVNAMLHCNAKIVISEDIVDFFGSTTRDQIFNIWRSFFRFPDDVSEILTALTTRHGTLPQGATTSPHLSNLVFWKDEPFLYQRLYQHGFTYSRFVDDICISSRETENDITQAISSVHGLMLKRGYKINRGKEEIQTSRGRMTATKLIVNGKRPTRKPEDRSNIRAAVYNLERRLNKGIFDRKEFNSVRGKVAHLRRFHPAEADHLMQRLDTILKQASG